MWTEVVIAEPDQFSVEARWACHGQSKLSILEPRKRDALRAPVGVLVPQAVVNLPKFLDRVANLRERHALLSGHGHSPTFFTCVY